MPFSASLALLTASGLLSLLLFFYLDLVLVLFLNLSPSVPSLMSLYLAFFFSLYSSLPLFLPPILKNGLPVIALSLFANDLSFARCVSTLFAHPFLFLDSQLLLLLGLSDLVLQSLHLGRTFKFCLGLGSIAQTGVFGGQISRLGGG
ncbi:hypothetical protein FGO68_gene9105 [Halteria grandinella]|uniref:Uncharacterized protein n=1 Tax=Halteria grandinella TaxID=5974 RepID=A0A8J8TAC8_HALGN|nr:hypothetical protein FGO68_gene9105 [Halteria grandinella]